MSVPYQDDWPQCWCPQPVPPKPGLYSYWVEDILGPGRVAMVICHQCSDCEGDSVGEWPEDGSGEALCDPATDSGYTDPNSGYTDLGSIYHDPIWEEPQLAPENQTFSRTQQDSYSSKRISESKVSISWLTAAPERHLVDDNNYGNYDTYVGVGKGDRTERPGHGPLEQISGTGMAQRPGHGPVKQIPRTGLMGMAGDSCDRNTYSTSRTWVLCHHGDTDVFQCNHGDSDAVMQCNHGDSDAVSQYNYGDNDAVSLYNYGDNDAVSQYNYCDNDAVSLNNYGNNDVVSQYNNGDNDTVSLYNYGTNDHDNAVSLYNYGDNDAVSQCDCPWCVGMELADDGPPSRDSGIADDLDPPTLHSPVTQCDTLDTGTGCHLSLCQLEDRYSDTAGKVYTPTQCNSPVSLGNGCHSQCNQCNNQCNMCNSQCDMCNSQCNMCNSQCNRQLCGDSARDVSSQRDVYNMYNVWVGPHTPYSHTDCSGVTQHGTEGHDKGVHKGNDLIVSTLSMVSCTGNKQHGGMAEAEHDRGTNGSTNSPRLRGITCTNQDTPLESLGGNGVGVRVGGRGCQGTDKLDNYHDYPQLDCYSPMKTPDCNSHCNSHCDSACSLCWDSKVEKVTLGDEVSYSSQIHRDLVAAMYTDWGPIHSGWGRGPRNIGQGHQTQYLGYSTANTDSASSQTPTTVQLRLCHTSGHTNSGDTPHCQAAVSDSNHNNNCNSFDYMYSEIPLNNFGDNEHCDCNSNSSVIANFGDTDFNDRCYIVCNIGDADFEDSCSVISNFGDKDVEDTWSVIANFGDRYVEDCCSIITNSDDNDFKDNCSTVANFDDRDFGDSSSTCSILANFEDTNFGDSCSIIANFGDSDFGDNDFGDSYSIMTNFGDANCGDSYYTHDADPNLDDTDFGDVVDSGSVLANTGDNKLLPDSDQGDTPCLKTTAAPGYSQLLYHVYHRYQTVPATGSHCQPPGSRESTERMSPCYVCSYSSCSCWSCQCSLQCHCSENSNAQCNYDTSSKQCSMQDSCGDCWSIQCHCNDNCILQCNCFGNWSLQCHCTDNCSLQCHCTDNCSLQCHCTDNSSLQCHCTDNYSLQCNCTDNCSL